MSLRDSRIAVVGASGNTGRSLLGVLSEFGVKPKQIQAFASSKSHGRQISFGESDTISVQALSQDINWKEFDIAFFAAGSSVSSKFADKAADSGCFVIDKSSFFRMACDVPLVVPEVNGHLIPSGGGGIVCSPNCVTIPLVIVLNTLVKNFGSVDFASVSTYQSVSGAGFKGMNFLDRQVKQYQFSHLVQHQDRGVDSESPFPRQIAFNVIPSIDELDPQTGATGEESKIKNETLKILDVPVGVTCVRVPVFVGHSMAVHVRFNSEIAINKVQSVLAQEDGIYYDEWHDYTTPIDCVGTDGVHVSRVRFDGVDQKGIMAWVVCDNLRKGAALNAAQIAKKYTGD